MEVRQQDHGQDWDQCLGQRELEAGILWIRCVRVRIPTLIHCKLGLTVRGSLCVPHTVREMRGVVVAGSTN